MVTRRDLLDMRLAELRHIGDLLKRAPIVVHEHHSLREAADHMVEENVGRVLVVSVEEPQRLIGILTRGDLLAAHARRLREAHDSNRQIRIRQEIRKRLRKAPAPESKL